MTKTKYSVPWIDVKIHYKRFRAHVQNVLRDAYWKHVSNIYLRSRTMAQIDIGYEPLSVLPPRGNFVCFS